MKAYLDNSATTPCSRSVCDLMSHILTEDYGNPSSMHLKGKEAEDYVKEARERIAKTLKVNEKEIVFTSGGTESNNLALIGAAYANKRQGKHLITTQIEHSSVGACMEYLQQEGYEISYLSVDANGQISLEELADLIREDTILVSMMQVNNEMGAIQPIEEAGKLIKEKNPKTLFHVDAIQSYGKMKINPKKLNVDLLSVSGHKFHGPKGSGFLYIKDKVKVTPLILGGGQQKGMRSGTENVPAIAGLGLACQEIYENHNEKIEQMRRCKARFVEGLRTLEDVHINGLTDEQSAPHVVSVSFKGVRSEVLLHTLEEKGIYVSAGSACASNRPAISSTLKAIGVPADLLDSTLRFSFSVHTTIEEIDYTLEVLEDVLPVLRRYTRH